MKYSDAQRIQKIYDNVVSLNKYLMENDIDKDMLLSSQPLQWLVTTPLYNIGEHVYNLSDEYKNKHANIQWKMIAGLRHRLVHDYDGINWNVIVDIVYEEIPELIKQLENIKEDIVE